MSYWDVFIRNSVEYAYPGSSPRRKYELKKMMARIIMTGEDPARPQVRQNVKSATSRLTIDN